MAIPVGYTDDDHRWGPPLSLPRRFAEAVVAAGVFSALYYGVGEYVAPAAAPLATALDRTIPFLPGSVWVYLPGYIGSFFIVLWVMKPTHAFRAALWAYLSLSLLALPFFVLYNVAGPRPPAPTDASLGAAMIRWLYTTDPIGNTFPSLHVANATLSALLCWRMDRRVGAFVTALAVGVAASVLTLKQHYLVDIPAGAILGWIGYGVWDQQLVAASARWGSVRRWFRAPLAGGLKVPLARRATFEQGLRGPLARDGRESRSSTPHDR